MGPANQNPAPGQPFSLPKDRQVSTIPKAILKDGDGPFWVYPSQQVKLVFTITSICQFPVCRCFGMQC